MRSGPGRVLAVLVSAVAVLAVIAGVVVAHRSTAVIDPRTPAGVVQTYLTAVIAGEYPAAATLLSPRSGCDAADVAAASVPNPVRVVLVRTAVDGDVAVVTVEVTEGAADDLFGSAGYTHTERLTLEREAGSWLILSSPWLLYSCGPTKE
ncbi:MAG: hypothetical protein ACYCTH_08530 [Cellulomonas sp.]